MTKLKRSGEDPEIRSMRVRAWVQAVKQASGLSLSELEEEFSQRWAQQSPPLRSCIWEKYQRGEVVPRATLRTKEGLSLVERVEKRYPGTARWLSLPVWRLVDKAPMDMNDIRAIYEGLQLEISNRDQRPIAVKEICWYVESFRTRWPAIYASLTAETAVEALHQHKIQTADLFALNIDIADIFSNLWATGNRPFLETIVAISTLNIGVILTTGEAIPQRTPKAFRAMLADQFIHPSWLATLVKLYVWIRRDPKI